MFDLNSLPGAIRSRILQQYLRLRDKINLTVNIFHRAPFALGSSLAMIHYLVGDDAAVARVTVAMLEL
jgi:hypothetical protein